MPTTSSTQTVVPRSEGEGNSSDTTPTSRKGQTPETSSPPPPSYSKAPLTHSAEGKERSERQEHRPYSSSYHQYDPVEHESQGKHSHHHHHFQSAPPSEHSHSYYGHHIMYSGSSSGGGTTAVPYPPTSGAYHAVPAPPHHGRTGPAPPQGYMVQSYVVTGPPGSGPPPGYVYAGPPPPGYHTSPTPPEGAPSHYERSGSAGFMDHPSMYPPPGSSSSPPVHRTNSTGAGSASSHAHHERAPAHSSMSHGYPPSMHHPPYPSGRPPSTYLPGGHPPHHPRPNESMGRPSAFEMDKRTAEEIQAERNRQAAEYELSLSRVKPIKTDYHWFAQKIQEEEEGVPPEIENDAFLRNSYLNARLKHRWEMMEQDERMEFLKKEEGDRRRFTEEEEVASRHCATLTARAPPAGTANKSKDKRPPASSDGSPPKKNKTEE